MKRYFLADENLVDRLTAWKQTVEEAEELFRDKFGYYPDIIKEIDALGGTIKMIKEGAIKESCAKTEALHGQEEIEQFAKMANQIGLKTMGDLKKFLDQEGEGKDVLTALKDYLVNDLGDINFQAKNESLDEGLNRTFIELPSFKVSWKNLGLDEEDLMALQNLILNSSEQGIPLGTNVYKIRFNPVDANYGKNKADRAIYVDIISDSKIYLVLAFCKSDEDNITKDELMEIKSLAKEGLL